MSGNIKNSELSEELLKALDSLRSNEAHAKAIEGMSVVSIGRGWAVGELEVQEKHLNPMNGVHGGVIFTFADSIGGSAACTCGHYMTTSTASISYFNAAVDTRKLIAKARTLKEGRSLTFCEVEIFTEEGKFIAKANMEYFRLDKIEVSQ